MFLIPFDNIFEQKKLKGAKVMDHNLQANGDIH